MYSVHAERVGFEPTEAISYLSALAGQHLRPLSQRSNVNNVVDNHRSLTIGLAKITTEVPVTALYYLRGGDRDRTCIRFTVLPFQGSEPPIAQRLHCYLSKHLPNGRPG